MGPLSATLNKRYNFDDRLKSQADGPNVPDNDSSYSKCIDDDTVSEFSNDAFKDISEASELSDNDSECMESNDDSTDMSSGDLESEIDALDVLENESNCSESCDGG